MDNEQERKLQEDALRHIVVALEGMRDTLMTCSLLLQEFHFDMDSPHRKEAVDRADTAITKARAESNAGRNV